MGRCFVIQPFDRGFNKRYDDVYEPAIREASLEPYRVDRDPAVVIPIEQIESEIRGSEACLADISTDNPNVWFELGFALASSKSVCLICSAERGKFPFDVQHRTIIRYETESKSDYEQLGNKITERLVALLARQDKLQQMAVHSPVAESHGLAAHEIAAMAIIMEYRYQSETVATWSLYNDMQAAGFTKIATSMAIEGLRRKGLLDTRQENDYSNGEYIAVSLLQSGIDWLLENQARFVMRGECLPHTEDDKSLPAAFEDNIPF